MQAGSHQVWRRCLARLRHRLSAYGIRIPQMSAMRLPERIVIATSTSATVESGRAPTRATLVACGPGLGFLWGGGGGYHSYLKYSSGALSPRVITNMIRKRVITEEMECRIADACSTVYCAVQDRKHGAQAYARVRRCPRRARRRRGNDVKRDYGRGQAREVAQTLVPRAQGPFHSSSCAFLGCCLLKRLTRCVLFLGGKGRPAAQD